MQQPVRLQELVFLFIWFFNSLYLCSAVTMVFPDKVQKNKLSVYPTLVVDKASSFIAPDTVQNYHGPCKV
jgi:hypothetical protein